MFDLLHYRRVCAQFHHKINRGRGAIVLNDHHLLSTNVSAQQMIVDVRHASSLKLLCNPPPAEASVLSLIMQSVKTGMVCAEVGGGSGYYSLFMAQLLGPYGKVYCFESIPECFQLINKNALLNDIRTIQAEHYLVGDCQGEETITYFGERYHFYFQPANGNEVKQVRCPTTPLDAYFEGKEECLDFIKINPSGSLYHIWRGMRDITRNSRDLQILCRFNHKEMEIAGDNPLEFLDEVSRAGFIVYALPTLKKVESHQLCHKTNSQHLLLRR